MKLLFFLLPGTLAFLSNCAPPCNGRIESTVLYAKPRPGGGRSIYVDVTNKPDLGRRQTLLWEGKEFGTFEHVVIVADPENKYALNRKICFNTYQLVAAETGEQLDEREIPRIRLAE